MNQEFLDRLCEIAGSDNVRTGEEMKKHTTFRIGGPADYYIIPRSAEETARVLAACKEWKVPFISWGTAATFWWETADTGERSFRFLRI